MQRVIAQLRRRRKMLYFYSIFITLIGCYAYFKVASLICLITSVLSGMIIGIAALYPKQRWLAYGVASFLGFFFTLNFINSPRFFPSGVVALVSLVVVLWPFVKKWQPAIGGLQLSNRRTQR